VDPHQLNRRGHELLADALLPHLCSHSRKIEHFREQMV
jgi:hypothetical protein